MSLPADDRDVLARHDRSIVNLSHDEPDGDLTQIQGLLRHANSISMVADRAELERALVRLASLLEYREQTLDLIAHAEGEALAFADWLIADDEQLRGFCERMKGPLSRYRALRLIGCGVASSEAGERAMARMRELLGIEVQGTTTIVSLEDFNPAGYDGGHLHTAPRAMGGGVVFPEGSIRTA